MGIGITFRDATKSIHLKIKMHWYIFLKDLQQYWTVNWMKDPADSSGKCQDYSQLQQLFSVLQNCKDYSWAMKNSTLVKLGAFLSKIKKELVVRNLVHFINISIWEEYIDLLVNCGWNVCIIGLFKIPYSDLRIKKTSCCCNVSNEHFIVGNNILATATNTCNF